MNYKSHLYVGTIAGITAAMHGTKIGIAEPALIYPLCIGFSAVGSLVPDIDKSGSRISKKTPILSFLIEHLVGHRGILHTPIFVILLIVLFNAIVSTYNLNNFIAYIIQAFIVGYISHLLIDLFTPKGLMLLFPLSTKYFRLIGLKSKYRDVYISIVATIIWSLYIFNNFV